ncbi:hypothetical protein K470DRAFT_268263 [Piedraia hortae CBS 480.64]|uniref:F-box domain-containing protein n=1 Tax=Piedraia hortae CBS 480.64 TaxID=1314780 RepID=A0A6A7C8R6_9PEZI|nr:hypothetical protein K470DRAFT_268263 [Piedraia hortae CBS 480.64]
MVSFPKIPLDILIGILELLEDDPRSLFNASIVSRAFADVAAEILWQNPTIETFAKALSGKQDLANKVRHLHVFCKSVVEDHGMTEGLSFPQLRQLVSGHCGPHRCLPSVSFEHFDQLTRLFGTADDPEHNMPFERHLSANSQLLHIHDMNRAGRAVELIPTKCPGLKHLAIGTFYDLSWSELSITLKRLKCFESLGICWGDPSDDFTGLSSLRSAFTKLRRLQLRCCFW